MSTSRITKRISSLKVLRLSKKSLTKIHYKYYYCDARKNRYYDVKTVSKV